MNRLIISGKVTTEPFLKDYGQHIILRFTIRNMDLRPYPPLYVNCRWEGPPEEYIADPYQLRGQEVQVAGPIELKHFSRSDDSRGAGIRLLVEELKMINGNSYKKPS